MDEMIQYELIRSKRKTVSLCVKEDGTVEVRAPKWVTKAEIQRFVDEKANWIIKKRQEAAKRNCVSKKHYTEDAVFACLSKEYRLHIAESGRNAVGAVDKPLNASDGEQDILLIKTNNTDEEYVKELLMKWCSRQLKEYVRKTAAEYMPVLTELAIQKGKSKPEIWKITIRNVKSRWGSCSAKGGLNFNVKLVMAPTFAVDYVIAHELCHLLYMNHQAEFWDAVQTLVPDYKERRRFLKENGWQYEF